MIVLFLICKGKLFLSTLMATVMCVHFSMQEEDILEHTNGKFKFVYTSVNL